MKKSRLNLFKSTSMLISLLGVLMIVCTIVLAGYIGFNIISTGITGEVSSGAQYDQLAQLKSNYSELESKFSSTKSGIFTGNNKAKEKQYIAAELELIRANLAIGDVESGLKSRLPSSEIDDRIKIATDKLKIAREAYDQL